VSWVGVRGLEPQTSSLSGLAGAQASGTPHAADQRIYPRACLRAPHRNARSMRAKEGTPGAVRPLPEVQGSGHSWPLGRPCGCSGCGQCRPSGLTGPDPSSGPPCVGTARARTTWPRSSTASCRNSGALSTRPHKRRTGGGPQPPASYQDGAGRSPFPQGTAGARPTRRGPALTSRRPASSLPRRQRGGDRRGPARSGRR
jgi:hypothetical protein